MQGARPLTVACLLIVCSPEPQLCNRPGRSSPARCTSNKARQQQELTGAQRTIPTSSDHHPDAGAPQESLPDGRKHYPTLETHSAGPGLGAREALPQMTMATWLTEPPYSWRRSLRGGLCRLACAPNRMCGTALASANLVCGACLQAH